jgi:hypothetical protein
MLYWIFLIILVVSIIGIILGNHFYNDFADFCLYTSVVTAIISVIVFGIMTIATIDANIAIEAKISSNQQRYEALVYQVENEIYDNDNDLGKYDLYNQVREWNEELAKGKANQYNFWYGIFYPNIYDNFDYIKLK